MFRSRSPASPASAPWTATPGRRRRAWLALAMCVAFAMQLPVWLWVVDDAAISFSYARNLAAGEGLVAQPGGERVEGYSNPLWVALLAAWELLGVGGFVSSKLMGALFGVLCVPLTWAIARWSRPDRDDWVPLLASLALAGNASFAIWSTSGLENSLFCLLLAAGTWRVLVETGTRGFPWSALCFLGVALTRPEGVLYAAVAGAAVGFFALRDRRGLRPAIHWAGVVLVPYAALQGLRFGYFGWAFPNTYYAKFGSGIAGSLDWHGPGWRYLRHWAGLAHADGSPGPGLGQALLLPLAILGIAGGRARGGSRALWLCAGLAATAAAFAVSTRGDWMNGYRWFSLLAVPSAVLIAAGAGVLREGLTRWTGAPLAGRLAVLALAVLWIAPQVRHLAWFSWNAPTGAYSVKRRVDSVHRLMDSLQLEHATVLDVDMGAHLYWSRAEVVDLAGLVDVPLARNGFDPAFLREYLFRERLPDFAHVHGEWAESSGITELPEWRADYVALPGYLGQRHAIHPGSHVRRDLLFERIWSGPAGRRVVFAGGVTLEGWELPGLPSAPGLELLVRVGIRGAGRAPVELEISVANDAAGIVAHRTVVPGHGWLPPDAFRAGEVFHGAFPIPLPRGVAPGRYDLAFALRDARGAVLPAVSATATAAAGWRPDPERAGVARFRGAVAVAAVPTALERNRVDLARLERRADAEDCIGAEQLWRSIRARMSGHPGALDVLAAAARRQLAECWAQRGAGAVDPTDQANYLARARRHDRRAPTLLARSGPAGRALYAAGNSARQREDWETAYRLYAAALRADPTLAFARRRAEAARSRRLASAAR